MRRRDDGVREPAGRGPRSAVAATCPWRPPAAAVAIAQDRIAEKRFLAGLGVPTAPFAVAGTADRVAFPAIVKTARLGYDGKGQRDVDDRPPSWPRPSTSSPSACVVEQRVPLDAEVSVLVARTADGRTVVYPVAENHHVAGILDLTVVPARVDRRRRRRGGRARRRASPTALAFVGVLAVELFVSGGRLLVNELAPRPHNSGHWTLDAAAHQPVRAAGAGGVRAGPRGARPHRRGGGDGQPPRRPVGGRRAGVGGGARRTGRPPAPLRQGGRSSRPQDGPPDRARARSPTTSPPAPSSCAAA